MLNFETECIYIEVLLLLKISIILPPQMKQLIKLKLLSGTRTNESHTVSGQTVDK